MGLDGMEYGGIAMEEAYLHRMRSSNGYSRKIFRLIPQYLYFPGMCATIPPVAAQAAVV